MLHPGKALSIQILQAYYPVVNTLGEYLCDIVVFDNGHADVGLIHETDTYVYRRLLETCIVTAPMPRQSKSLHVTPPMGYLREVRQLIDILHNERHNFRPPDPRTCPDKASYEMLFC